MLHATPTFLLLLAGVCTAASHNNESAPHSPPCPSVDTSPDLTLLTTDSPVPVSRRSVAASELLRAHISSATARTDIVSRLISAALRRVFRRPDTLGSRIKRQASGQTNVLKIFVSPPVRGTMNKTDPKPMGPIEVLARQPRKQQSRQTPHYEFMEELEDHQDTTTISSRKESRIPLTKTTSKEQVIESSYLQSQQQPEQESWQQDDKSSSGSRCTNQLMMCLLIAAQTAILSS